MLSQAYLPHAARSRCPRAAAHRASHPPRSTCAYLGYPRYHSLYCCLPVELQRFPIAHRLVLQPSPWIEVTFVCSQLVCLWAIGVMRGLIMCLWGLIANTLVNIYSKRQWRKMIWVSEVLENCLLGVCVCVCVYICMYVCMHVCMYACMYMWACVFVCMCVCARVCVCVDVSPSFGDVRRTDRLG